MSACKISSGLYCKFNLSFASSLNKFKESAIAELLLTNPVIQGCISNWSDSFIIGYVEGAEVPSDALVPFLNAIEAKGFIGVWPNKLVPKFFILLDGTSAWLEE